MLEVLDVHSRDLHLVDLVHHQKVVLLAPQETHIQLQLDLVEQDSNLDLEILQIMEVHHHLDHHQHQRELLLVAVLEVLVLEIIMV